MTRPVLQSQLNILPQQCFSNHTETQFAILTRNMLGGMPDSFLLLGSAVEFEDGATLLIKDTIFK